MNNSYKATAFLLLSIPILASADNAPAGAASSYVNNSKDRLRDPTAQGRNYSNATEALITDRKPRHATPETLNGNSPHTVIRAALSDPTQMSSNFRQALQQLKVRTTTTQLKTTGNLPPFPNVSLAAIVYGEDQEAFSMLHIDDKTVLVRVGDKASFVDKDKVIDLVVKEINRSDVHLAVYPANETIILR